VQIREVALVKPSPERRQEFLAAVKRSRRLHGNWVSPPKTARAFDESLAKLAGTTHVSYWVCTETGELAGVFNISEIVRGVFQSAYLGYYALAPHAGRGYMRAGLQAVLAKAFGAHRLHRLEANIQPDNEASRILVRNAGFRVEGLSRRYLKVAGRWRNHERWAITIEDWRALHISPHHRKRRR
jgi:[ribosomal protein S5]-alanine N-acetyltransferase